jgi:hypothetical protein
MIDFAERIRPSGTAFLVDGASAPPDPNHRTRRSVVGIEGSDEVVVYFAITLAAHVSLTEARVLRVVELREEIHPNHDAPMLVSETALLECDAETAERARSIAESASWPANWEFGY